MTEEFDEKIGEEEERRSPFWYIIAPILILLLIMMIIPHYAIRLDPEPRNIPALPDVLPAAIYTMNLSQARHSSADLGSFDFSNDQVIKQVADRVAAQSCLTSKVCHSKALFYFVRDNINYVSDPEREYIKSPHETLLTGAGDCDDMAVLLLNLQEAVGIEARYASKPQHLYVQVALDAPKKYQQDGWISLDATCKTCKYGEKP